MRITGGEWRSRKLRGPGRDSRIRPTPDAMRERVFSVLGNRVAGARFLDLYSGTGVVGLEALSRGAAAAVFVDPHPTAVKLIRANRTALCDDRSRARVVRSTARAEVERLARRRERFDIVWADPPFEQWRDGLDAVLLAFQSDLVTANGIACLECPDQAEPGPDLPADLEIVRDLGGGASRVVIISRR